MLRPSSKLIVVFGLAGLAGCSGTHHVATSNSKQPCGVSNQGSEAICPGSPEPLPPIGTPDEPGQLVAKRAVSGAFGIVHRVEQFASPTGKFKEGDSLIIYRAQNEKASKGLYVSYCGPLYALAGTLWMGDRIAIKFAAHSEMIWGDTTVMDPAFTERELTAAIKHYSESKEFRDLELSCGTRKHLDQ